MRPTAAYHLFDLPFFPRIAFPPVKLFFVVFSENYLEAIWPFRYKRISFSLNVSTVFCGSEA